MNKLLRPIIVLLLMLNFQLSAQIDPNSLMGLPTVPTIADMNGIVSPILGSILYNLEDNTIYRYDGTTWLRDDQNAQEVPLVINVDVNGTTGDPTPTNETNVEEAIQAIAPITSKAGRVFFPPSIEIDASTNGTGRTVDLYNQYLLQYSLTPPPVGVTPVETAISAGAPATIPVYLAAELYYYVTYADPAVFDNISISNVGVMTYDIVGQPVDDNTLINVVFVVK